MKFFNRITGSLIVLGSLPFVLAGCGAEVVSFSQDVKPILDQNCLTCHKAGGEGFIASGFSMESYDGLMKGTRYGPMVIPGDSFSSNMVVLMEGRADPSISMPFTHGKWKSIAKQDIQTIKLWIDQGGKNN